MSYPKTNAPWTNRRGYLPATDVVFDVVNNGDSVTLGWAGLPLLPTGQAFVAHMVSVGKEYTGPRAEGLRECSGQGMYCVTHPDNFAEPLPDCYTDTWDSPIGFQNYNANGVTSITVPYNKFMLAANGCAFQTDGATKTYYVELACIAGGAAYKIKWLFDYATPIAPFTACGVGEEVIPPPPPVTEPTPGKGKGQGPKK